MTLGTLAWSTTLPDGVTMAHPQPSHPHVAIPLLVIAICAPMVVALAASWVPAREPAQVPSEPAERSTQSWPGRLGPAQQSVRALSVLALLLVIVAGRLGADDELDNIAPALAVGAGLPLLVVGCLLFGTLWRWVDPWDGMARLMLRGDDSHPPAHVWPAVAVAVAWMWFLSAYSRPLDPRSVGAAVALHSVVTLAGCVALGRGRWLGSGEPLGLVLSWIGLLPRRRLSRWRPPRGAGALLGVLIAGLLFGGVRRTTWFSESLSASSSLVATLGVGAACALGAALGTLAARWGTSAQRAAAVQALVPATAAVALAIALARNRLFSSVQLLPGLLGDPLGRGWDLLGSPTSGLDPAPLGATGLIVLQLCLVGVLHLGAAAVTVRSLVGDERIPVIGVLSASVGLAMLGVGLH